LQWLVTGAAQFLNVTFDTPLVLNATYIVDILFESTLNSYERGFYYDKYTARDGSTKSVDRCCLDNALTL